MKYRLMDLLACPICRSFPLELHVFRTRRIEVELNPVKCEVYCGYASKRLDELEGEPACSECWRTEIIDGLLFCESCRHWYPIEDEIPRMLPDDLRDRNDDLRFLATWRSRIPEEILRKGKPFSLSAS
ncbi:MAG: Trm112 family protein [Nitrososphaerota archaeon]